MTDAQRDPVDLRQRSEGLAARLPALLVQAERLAASVYTGVHGRRRAGPGEDFWQYRPAQQGDNWRGIDWRRSARGDATYIRQREWQAAQAVYLWIDHAASMEYSGDKDRPTKGALSGLLGLATAILLNRGGERVGLIEDERPPRTGRSQIDRIVAQIMTADRQVDYGQPKARDFEKGARVLMLSDFLGDWDQIAARIKQATDRGATGALVMVLDPTEESFPFDGRTEFLSMTGAIRFETLRARALRSDYKQKLAERKDRIATLCRTFGWQMRLHHTGDSAVESLAWIYQTLERRR